MIQPMQFLIADSFTDSLSRLNGEEQKEVKTTAFDLQMNPANPRSQRGRSRVLTHFLAEFPSCHTCLALRC